MADPIPARKAPYGVDVVAGRTKKLWFCGCKATTIRPFCDGTHNALA